MLIVKRGTLPHKYREFECKNCGCVFIADKIKGEYIVSHTDTGKLIADCPCCKKKVFWFIDNGTEISDEEYNRLRSQYEQKG